ncbi:polyprenyl synthetase family protein [Nocardia sp. NPDC052566]|uniref:terpene synthase family protein n=1 Tax=Nocardia sp. NPDC052566 TaxID=3364330 RepID=UPI0037CA44FC
MLSRLGSHLDMAFQLVDDLLDIWGDPEITGRSAGSDLRRRQKSLPVVAVLMSGVGARFAQLMELISDRIPSCSRSRKVDAMAHYVIPPLYHPTLPRCHPDVDLINLRTMEWMRGMGFCPTTADENAVSNIMAGDLAAHWFPEQPTDRVQWISDIWCFVAHLDDLRLEVGETSPISLGRLIAQMALIVANHRTYSAESMDTPILAALYDITDRAHQLGGEVRAARYTGGFGFWLLSVLADTTDRDVLSPADFLRMRFISVGAPFMLDIANIVCPQAVSAETWHDPKFVAAGYAAMMTATLDNDMISYGKERHCADTTGKWPSASTVRFWEVGNYDTGAAFAKTADYRNRFMCLWQHLRAELRPEVSSESNTYLDALDLIIAGSLQHHLTGSRYHNPDGRHPHAVTFDINYTSACPVTDHSPPASSVAWWWDQLSRRLHRAL